MIRETTIGEVVRFDLARTMLGRGRYWTSAYLVGDILIDSGPAHTASEIGALLAPCPIRLLVNTHTHEDHIGGNWAIIEPHPEARILAHPLALDVLEHPRQRQPLQFYRRLFWGWPVPSQGEPLMDGQLIEGRGIKLQVIYTPGHSPDHICLFEPDRGWLFTGDLFVGGKDRALGAEYDVWGILASLKRLTGLPVRVLFPGSARVRENGAQALREKIDYLERAGEQVLDLRRQGISEKRIARMLFGGPMMVELLTGGHFSRRNLVRSYLRQTHPSD